jgi:uncharacterized membrane protein
VSLLHFLFRQTAWQEVRIQQLTEGMNAMTSDQSHLDQDVTELQTGFAEVVAELKAQAAAGQPLNFAAADALVGTVQAEATADAPPAPAPAPAAPAADVPAATPDQPVQ